MSKKMISPEGVKANILCASCEHCKLQCAPKTGLWKSRCLKHNEWLDDSGGYCDDYEMEKFFAERGYKEVK